MGKEYLLSALLLRNVGIYPRATVSVGSLIMGIIIGNRKKQMKYGLTVRNNLIIFALSI